MEKEIWKQAIGLEGYFEVSTHGRIRSTERVVCSGSGKYRACFIKRPRILKCKVSKNGYITAHTRINGLSKHVLVHRIVAMTFLGNSKLLVNHKDCDKTNNRIENLEFVTHQQNMDHAKLSNRFRCPHKIDERTVLLLKFFRLLGVKRSDLARVFKVHTGTISQICPTFRSCAKSKIVTFNIKRPLK